MAHITDITLAKVSRMGEQALKDWIETVVARMGIPVSSVSQSTDQYDGEVILGGDFYHCYITVAPGSYAVWAYNSFRDEEYIIDGKGKLHDELVEARNISMDTEGL